MIRKEDAQMCLDNFLDKLDDVGSTQDSGSCCLGSSPSREKSSVNS